MWYSQLLELDTAVFQHINQGWSNPIFDYILPLLRSKHFWLPVYTFIISYLFFNFRSSGWKFLILIFIGVGISDSVSSHLIKKNIERVRPCHRNEISVKARVPCGSGFSLPSSHASNHFVISLMLIFGLIDRRWLKWLVMIWAIIICLAQVYVGVHYPSDVFVGSVLGLTIGYTVFVIGKRYGMTIEDQEQ